MAVELQTTFLLKFSIWYVATLIEFLIVSNDLIDHISGKLSSVYVMRW